MQKHGEHQLSAQESVDSERVGCLHQTNSLFRKLPWFQTRCLEAVPTTSTSVTRNRNTVLSLSTQPARTLQNCADMAGREGRIFCTVSWTLAYKTVTFTVKRSPKTKCCLCFKPCSLTNVFRHR